MSHAAISGGRRQLREAEARRWRPAGRALRGVLWRAEPPVEAGHGPGHADGSRRRAGIGAGQDDQGFGQIVAAVAAGSVIGGHLGEHTEL